MLNNQEHLLKCTIICILWSKPTAAIVNDDMELCSNEILE